MANLIVVPAHNASSKIVAVLEGLAPFREHVLVIDDGSTDNTGELAEKMEFAVLPHPDNRGVGAAIKTGLRYALERGYERIVTLDADGQHDPTELSAFLQASSTFDLVIGNRFRQSMDRVPDPKIAANLVAALIVHDAFGVRLADVTCGYRSFTCTEWMLELPANDYGFLYQQLLYCISHDREIGSVPVAAIYDVSSPAVTRAEEIRAFLHAVLLYANGTVSRQKVEATLLAVLRREDFVHEVGGHMFGCLYRNSDDCYLVQADDKRVRKTMEELAKSPRTNSLGGHISLGLE
jgi:glycosyltransferase involved in cell wall biosynthesis